MRRDPCAVTDRGRGNKDPKWKDRSRGRGRRSALPVLADVEAPLPGKVVCSVIISEEGCDHVGAPHQRTPWRLLHGTYELILLGARAITAHHVHGLVHWGRERTLGASLCPTRPAQWPPRPLPAPSPHLAGPGGRCDADI